jgi:hypothetical protein
MKQLKNAEEMVGKRIQRIAESRDTLGIAFDDETFIVLKAENLYDDSEDVADLTVDDRIYPDFYNELFGDDDHGQKN